MSSKRIPLAKPWYDTEELRAVKEVLASGWSAQGPRVAEFEKITAETVGTRFAIAVNSGTSALYLSLLSLGISKGDEVLVPDFTFPATGNVVYWCGASPILVDISPSTYNIDLKDLKRQITVRSRAIIPVDTFGFPCDYDEILDIADDIPVVADAACSQGATYKGRKVGGMARLNCFSFHARKLVATGEGGMILTNDPDLAEKARLLRSHGMKTDSWTRHIQSSAVSELQGPGHNLRMSDLTAAVGIAQIRKLEAQIRKRQQLGAVYDDVITSRLRTKVRLPLRQNDRTHTFQSYVVQLTNGRSLRDEAIIRLRNMGIGATIGTYSLSGIGQFIGQCPNGIKAFETTLALPMFHEMSEEDVHYVVASLAKIL